MLYDWMRDVFQACDRNHQGFVPTRKVPLLLLAANYIPRDTKGKVKGRRTTGVLMQRSMSIRERSTGGKKRSLSQCRLSGLSSIRSQFSFPLSTQSLKSGIDRLTRAIEGTSKPRQATRGDGESATGNLGIMQVQQKLVECLIGPGTPGSTGVKALFERYADKRVSRESHQCSSRSASLVREQSFRLPIDEDDADGGEALEGDTR